jgi:hypothetical protein
MAIDYEGGMHGRTATRDQRPKKIKESRLTENIGKIEREERREQKQVQSLSGTPKDQISG